jgi:hypothetical protein
VTYRERRTVEMLRGLSAYLRRTEEVSWPGLPDQPGARTTVLGANTFLLGCLIDGQQPAERAWRVARRFVFGIVPESQRAWFWHWIIKNHTEREWNACRHTYALHRFGAWHNKVYRTARVLVDLFDGDARGIWRSIPSDTNQVSYVQARLGVIGMGPAIARMTAGALRDCRLIEGSGSFKDDRHVRRIMKVLGLSRSDSSQDVLAAGRRLLGDDSWAIDYALFHLGKQRLSTRSAIERYCRRVGLRDGRRLDREGVWRKRIAACRDIAVEVLGAAQRRAPVNVWKLDVGNDEPYVGMALSRRRGRFARDVESGEAGVWAGFWLDSDSGYVNVGTELVFDVRSRLSASLRLRDALIHDRYVSEWVGNLEYNWRVLRRFPLGQDVEQLRGSLGRLLVRGAMKTLEMLNDP